MVADCEKAPSSLEKNPLMLIWVREERNLDLYHTKPASLFAYKGVKSPLLSADKTL